MAEAVENHQQQQPQAPPGRSWKQTIIQIVLFQLVMHFFKPRPQPPRDPTTNALIPDLLNSFKPNVPYDVYFHISTNSSSTFTDVRHHQNTDTLIWFLPDQVYSYARGVEDRKTLSSLQYSIPSAEIFNAIITQHLSEQLVDEEQEDESLSPSNLLDRMSGLTKLRKQAERRKDWMSLYLVASAVQHALYEEQAPQPTTLEEARQMLMDAELSEPLASKSDMVPRGVVELIEYMKPAEPEEGIHLLDPSRTEEGTPDSSKSQQLELPHWKDHLDVRMVYDAAPLTPQSMAAPHIKKYVQTVPEKGLYHPILVPTDLWLIERNFIELNSTHADQPLNLTVSFNTLGPLWWMVQAQLIEMWDPKRGLDANQTSFSPRLALGSTTRRETFMIKRIFLDTNRYILAFSALFMMAHSVFSFLSFKNDISFWTKNESMEGLSALSTVVDFISELVIALYLWDSEKTSYMILIEIFVGVAIAAWKVTRAINVFVKPKPGQWLPRLQWRDKKDYEESETKKYDRVAIKIMSVALLPCCLGYAVYCLKTKKYKSWFSFVISTLAGSVYTFGFIMMTPQLYINYKRKSVKHLPWRTLTYKALNTFVDDIAAFIIDMPTMHRIACLRDDVIFICYIYQRWIYSVEPEEDKRTEIKDATELGEAEELKQLETAPAVRARKGKEGTTASSAASASHQNPSSSPSSSPSDHKKDS